MTEKLITISFYTLFFLTPLFWTPFNFELFEYNKMMLVYLLTIIITASWIIKMIKDKTLLLKRTPLDLPILIFLLANILSTIFSIDPHTSVWGYYSRSNGGLLSTISYLILYYALVSNFNSQNILKLLKVGVYSGFIVALWAIPEHFGVSPSCILLTGNFSASCWVQDVQARVFATLGQPNWLAGYLSMLMFPALYFFLTAKKKVSDLLYLSVFTALYMAATFTKSRAGALGIAGGLTLLVPAIIYLQRALKSTLIIKLGLSLAVILVVSILYGSALVSRFEGIDKTVFGQKQQTPLNQQTSTPKSSQTQLEVEGGETPKIRFIVWKGALNIFKHYPIFGSGVETFAYSYYNFRPKSHNLTSEWDFLYNKAHNEFLNYLATTGIVGFGSYVAIILTFIIWSIKKIFKIQLPTSNLHSGLLTLAILASYLSYHIQNFFGFSVVIIALFFYLFPAIVFIATDSLKPFKFPKQLYPIPSTLNSFLYRKSLYPKLAQFLVIFVALMLTLKLINYYQADIYYAQGLHADETGNPGKAYNALAQAKELNPGEPLYRSELGYAAASAALSLQEEDATISSQLKQSAINQTQSALLQSPKNVSLLRTAIRTYYLLSEIDKNYTQKTLEILDITISLAPTDSKLTYNKAIILGQENKNKEAIGELKKTIQLKPNYRDAYYSLGLFYFDDGQKEKAIEAMKDVLKLIPNDSEATDKLKEWSK